MNSRAVGVLLLVVAVGVLAHPLYLWPHYGETPYFAYSSPADEVDGTVVDYASLSPEARAVFDESLDGQTDYLYESEDSAAIETFEDVHYVRKDGTVYEIWLAHVDDNWLLGPLVRLPLSLLGGLLAVVGLRRLRPDTFGSRLWYVGGAALGLGSLVVLDAFVSGSGSAAIGLVVLFPAVGILLVVAAGIVAGQALHRQDRWSALAFVGLLAVVGLVAAGPVRFLWFAPFVTVPFFLVVALLGIAIGYISRRGEEDGATAAA